MLGRSAGWEGPWNIWPLFTWHPLHSVSGGALLFGEWRKGHFNSRLKEPESLGCSWWVYAESLSVLSDGISWIFWFVFDGTAERHICARFICVSVPCWESSRGIIHLLEHLRFLFSVEQAHPLNCLKSPTAFFLEALLAPSSVTARVFLREGGFSLSLRCGLAGHGVQQLGLPKAKWYDFCLILAFIFKILWGSVWFKILLLLQSIFEFVISLKNRKTVL